MHSTTTYKWRALQEELEREWERREAILIKGPRQAGKTTLLKHLQEVKGGTYYTLDHPGTLRLFENAPEELVVDDILYIDEVQNSPRAGPILRYLYDEHRVKLVISGSGAFERKIGIAAHLVGRVREHTLLPLSFEEYLRWHSDLLWRVYRKTLERVKGFIEGEEVVEVNGAVLKASFHNYMEIGGYPQAVLERRKEKVVEIVKATIERDILYYFRVPRKPMEAFFTFLSHNAGLLLNLSQAPVEFKTAKKYLELLEDAYMVKTITPYHRHPLKELRKRPKVYFYDVGVYRLFSGRPGFDGEHFVFRHLLPAHFWRSKGKAEVDFVVGEPPIPVEVKSLGKPTPSLKAFIELYDPPYAIIYHLHPHVKEEKLGDTRLLYIPLWLAAPFGRESWGTGERW